MGTGLGEQVQVAFQQYGQTIVRHVDEEEAFQGEVSAKSIKLRGRRCGFFVGFFVARRIAIAMKQVVA
jgi:hypothetical protein